MDKLIFPDPILRVGDLDFTVRSILDISYNGEGDFDDYKTDEMYNNLVIAKSLDRSAS